jgi:hypothetical protein
MTESDPFRRIRRLKPTKAVLKGPNVRSTFDKPLRPQAIKAQVAAIRKHLQGHRPGDGPSSPAK